MRVQPVHPVYSPTLYKPRASAVQKYDQFTIRDRETGETQKVDAANWWEIFNQVNNRGVIV